MKNYTYLYLGSLFVVQVLMTSCQQSKPQTENKKTDSSEIKKNQPKETKVERPTDRKFQDLSKYVAGISSEEGSSFKDLEKNGAWLGYASQNNIQWSNTVQPKFLTMSEWANTELKEVNEKKGLLFYPFSGPDFLHATAFFHEMDEIVMIGLEPAGTLPDPKKMNDKGTLNTYFAGMNRALYSILGLSFFQTNSMQVDYTGRVAADLDGTLSTILFFMSRTNHKILYYERIAINSDGKIVPASEVKVADVKKDSTYYGNRVDFENSKDGKRKSLYYFGVNLSNDVYIGLGGLNQRSDLKKYLSSLNITATYLKSASFLMYKPFFSIIKEVILDKSQYVLQDDSGMAFSNFTSGSWDLTLYGRYAGPIPLFANYWQNDMAQAYTMKKYPVKNLPFGIGYQYVRGNSNLMLAKKIEKAK
jgi:hypothetical protein